MQPVTRMFSFQLSEQEVLVIGKGLSELAYKEAAPVVNSLQAQVNEQLNEDKKEPVA